jgi:iron-sulfur cluster repair protein YtfE (RIC family)
VKRFFALDLTPHFQCEEEILFPAMSVVPGAAPLIDELINEHHRLDQMVKSTESGAGISRSEGLMQLADLLESHIRKEERQLFPLYEKHTPPPLQAKVGAAIVERIGEGLHPRNPDLLK